MTTWQLGFAYSYNPPPAPPPRPSGLPPGLYSLDSEGRVIAGPPGVDAPDARPRRLASLIAK